jgi:hypothetical protein
MSPREKTIADLTAHLDFLGIECAAQSDGNMLILDPLALFDHLTDEDFAARPAATLAKSAAPPVPVHKTHNPVGALQEWTQSRGPDARPPVYGFSENVGTVHAPMFCCSVSCDGEKFETKAPSKQTAKREAAQGLLVKLAVKHGAEKTS